jgi:hypothetical protein
MNPHSGKSYSVKRGPADPFRGDWYDSEVLFQNLKDAVESAFVQTLNSFNELGNSWEQYGYEWSVFSNNLEGSDKIWEGYKCIAEYKNGSKENPVLKDGFL